MEIGDNVLQAVTDVLQIPSTDGVFKFTDYAGKYLVLYFYPKDCTPGCTNESKDFRDLYAQFAGLKAQVVGVSRDSVESHNKFKEEHELPFPLVSDKESKLCKLFSVIKEKSMFSNTVLGVERSTFLLDPQGTLLAQWRKVKVAGHAQAVLDKLKTL